MFTGSKPLHKPVQSISREEREKGWISLSSAKMNTHNYHLRNKQLQASSKFIQKITPQKLRGVNSNSVFLASTGNAAELPMVRSLVVNLSLLRVS